MSRRFRVHKDQVNGGDALGSLLASCLFVGS